ncbi:hypothetical protein FAZ19_07060 [Sphingobacterium alkalisoli]|uniref:Uncharacterized protein n=1 Tax=Sphingobacterium alkalisoli TaxID=1874115 RepID=A0A4U0H4R8_9SPHI|nr:hypothetical protein [Sphingobacterium alkalisoli]TJY66670.1 hypothetical protein FAZ19_07060 [Sphingobacterium alkalisoli]GGH14911.1 hypothetical protein GCM10011418_16220 [Sphingobacterium alkalisoli]
MERKDNKMIGHFLRVSGLLLLLASLSGCRQDGKHKVDEFYTEKGEWDSARIPFIKPYEAVIVDEKYGWGMNLMALDGGTFSFTNIRKANIDNGFILVHTGNTLMLGVEVKESWWIVSPSLKIEKGFTDHPQYLAYLKKLGFKNEPKLHTIDVIANYYEDHDTMDWSALD